ncbi:MAG: hypothetical protein LWW85_07880 [Marinilabiliales bacterium]|nr:hypothetical protein [Marinilabiliales bacterium]
MKKIWIAFLLILSLEHFSHAQTGNHVLGLRFGSGDGFGTEISYQYGLSTLNRLEFDLGFNNHHEYYNSVRNQYNSWGLTTLYHWVHPIDNDFKWYIGPGAKIGSWSYNSGFNYQYDNGLFLVAAGDIGIEYTFPVGIQLALSARPELGLLNHGTDINVGFAIRYQFK